MRTSWIASALLAVSFIGSAHAQEATGSGSQTEAPVVIIKTTEEILETILAASGALIVEDRTLLLVQAQKQAAWDTASQRIKDRQARHRRECRESIRKANRDSLMSTGLQCYRGDLLQEIQWLREWKQYLALVPSIREPIKGEVNAKVDQLIDAQTTIIDGIDAQLFEHMESLEQAKRNLRTQYRSSYWLAVMKLRADRELTNLNFIVKKLDTLYTQKDLGPAFREFTIKRLALCLDPAWSDLHATLQAADWFMASQSLKEAQQKMTACEPLFEELVFHEQLHEQQKMENPQGE